MIYSEITLLSSWMMTSAELIRHYLAAALYAASVTVQVYTSLQITWRDDIMDKHRLYIIVKRAERHKLNPCHANCKYTNTACQKNAKCVTKTKKFM